MSAVANVLRARSAVLAPVLLACAAVALKTGSNAGTLALVAVAAAALLVPVVREQVHPAAWVATTAAGVALFALGRSLGAPLGNRLGVAGIVAVVIAGVAEEALFRRTLYGLIAQRRGEIVALVAAAIAFAAVHIPFYGTRTIALNLAAGLVLGWQRMASRSWSSPATTHALANLMQARWL